MRHLQALSQSAQEQLKEGIPGNFHTQAKLAKSKISKALEINDLIAARSAAAAYGGLIKRWRRWLIEEITDVTLLGVDTSRESVRKWQSEVFGQAVASSRLCKYSKPERSGGGRAEPIQLLPGLAEAAEKFYARYSEKLKQI